jgi:hypothetical protein
MGSFGKNSTTFNQAGNTWTPANIVAGVALNPLYHVHSLYTFAENDVTSVAPCTGVGGDEKLRKEKAKWVMSQTRNHGVEHTCEELVSGPLFAIERRPPRLWE